MKIFQNCLRCLAFWHLDLNFLMNYRLGLSDLSFKVLFNTVSSPPEGIWMNEYSLKSGPWSFDCLKVTTADPEIFSMELQWATWALIHQNWPGVHLTLLASNAIWETIIAQEDLSIYFLYLTHIIIYHIVICVSINWLVLTTLQWPWIYKLANYIINIFLSWRE